MKAVVTTGIGGFERLVYRDVPEPVPLVGEVLVQVLAAGVNQTDVNTRLGWYDPPSGAGGDGHSGGWQGSTVFPLIQGTDCCGLVVDAPDRADRHLIGRRVLVRSCMRVDGFGSMDTTWLGSDRPGAFAEYVTVPSSEVFPVDCDWGAAELGSIPCSWATAENMLGRARVGAGDHVLVTGASGGVGSAAVQLARRRGATVTAVCDASKAAAVGALGAERTVDRSANLADALRAAPPVDVAVDNVGGRGFGRVVGVLRRGGRYVTSGAIAGAIAELDLRTIYLRDLTLIGCTAWDERVLPDLVGYIERGEVRPVVASVQPLHEIAEAQRRFLEKRHVGKFVLIPPGAGS